MEQGQRTGILQDFSLTFFLDCFFSFTETSLSTPDFDSWMSLDLLIRISEFHQHQQIGGKINEEMTKNLM
jgi:hypothetical protein